jgi:hypothetical protein
VAAKAALESLARFEREHGRHDWLDAAIDQLFHLDELLPA